MNGACCPWGPAVRLDGTGEDVSFRLYLLTSFPKKQELGWLRDSLSTHQLSCNLFLLDETNSEYHHLATQEFVSFYIVCLKLSAGKGFCLTMVRELRKLSYKVPLLNSHQLWYNSSPRLTRTWELRKLTNKLSLGNSRELSCNSCSPLTTTWELRKLSYKLLLVNSYQFSCNSCPRLTRTWELRKLTYKLLQGNSHQLSCNSCSHLTRTRELRKLPCKQNLACQPSLSLDHG